MDEKTLLKRILTVQDSMFRLAKRLLTSNEEAEEAVQEVITKVWVNISEMATITNIEGNTMTMTKN